MLVQTLGARLEAAPVCVTYYKYVLTSSDRLQYK